MISACPVCWIRRRDYVHENFPLCASKDSQKEGDEGEKCPSPTKEKRYVTRQSARKMQMSVLNVPSPMEFSPSYAGIYHVSPFACGRGQVDDAVMQNELLWMF